MSLSSAILALNPIGYWKCNETSGTTLVDSSGYSNNLNITGTYSLNQTPVTGADPSILFANGKAATVAPMSLQGGNLNNGFTVIAFCCRTGDSGFYDRIIQAGNDGTGNNLMLLKQDGANAFDIGGWQHDVRSMVDFDIGTNFFAAKTINAAKLISFYVDGILDSTLTYQYEVNSITSMPVAIGSPVTESGSKFYGRVSHVAVFNYVLSPQQIAGIYSESTTNINLTLSLPSGSYPSASTIEISSDVPAATIYYTTDGTDPNVISSVYSSGIPMFTGTLKALGILNGYNDSAIVSANYSVSSGSVPEFDSSYSISGTANIIEGANTVEIYSDGNSNASLIRLMIGMTLSSFMTSGTTTIDGGMITTGSITADKLVVGALRITDSLQLDPGVVITGSIGENQVTTIASANVSDVVDVSLSIELTESTQKIIVWFSCTLYVDDDSSDAEYTISHGSTELMRAFWSTKGTLAFSKSIVYSPGSSGTITFTGANLSDSGATVTDKTIVLLVCKR